MVMGSCDTLIGFVNDVFIHFMKKGSLTLSQTSFIIPIDKIQPKSGMTDIGSHLLRKIYCY